MMKSAAVLATLFASASAFAPVPTTSSSTALKASVWEEYDGGVDFLGRDFQFDPVSIFQKNSCY